MERSYFTLSSIDTSNITSDKKPEKMDENHPTGIGQKKYSLVLNKNFMRHFHDQKNYAIAVEDFLPGETDNAKLTVRVGDLFKVLDREKGLYFHFISN